MMRRSRSLAIHLIGDFFGYRDPHARKKKLLRSGSSSTRRLRGLKVVRVSHGPPKTTPPWLGWEKESVILSPARLVGPTNILPGDCHRWTNLSTGLLGRMSTQRKSVHLQFSQEVLLRPGC